MDHIKLTSSSKIYGAVELPGSKSITNRVLLLASLAEGDITINKPLLSDDTNYMLSALQQLGIVIEKEDGNIVIKGSNGKFPVNKAELFLGNAGTAFRPLTAALCLNHGQYTLSGVKRMHQRPIKDLVDALFQIGAKVEYIENEGYPPLAIYPGKIQYVSPIKIRGDVSSQFLSSILMAFALTKNKIKIEIIGDLISKPYIEITLKLLKQFGIIYVNKNWKNFTLQQPAKLKNPKIIEIEGDASSASYFFAAAAIAGEIEVKGINKNSIQGDIDFLNILKKMGAKILYKKNSIVVSKADNLIGLKVDCKMIPDAAMTLATLSLFANGPTELINIGSWRVKETDRILAMETELRKIGAKVSSTQDSIKIYPPKEIYDNIAIDTYDDHRMAMCFSLICLAEKNVIINDPNCVAKTFPNFFNDFTALLNGQ